MADNVFRFPGAARPQAGRRLIPARLRAARKALGLSQTELAEAVGVTRQAVSQYEAGEKSPEPQTFERLAAKLEQPVSFFTTEGPTTFGLSSTRFYRKFGRDTKRRNEASDVLGEWFVQTTSYLDQFVNYPVVDLPNFEPTDPANGYTFDEVQEAANRCRARWGLGLGPLSNVLALLENKGVAICRYEMTGENVEAFSYWNGSRPFIFMASEKESGVRTRFDLAHEAGHLVLHRWMEQYELENPETLKRVEKEANWFAGALLLPNKSFPNEIYTARLEGFLPLKLRWRVSLQAMIYRCSDLEIFDADQVLNLRKQISARKWRTKEPYDNPAEIQLEQPRLLRRAFEMVVENGRRHPDEVLSELCLSPALIERFYGLPEGQLRGSDPGNAEPTLK